MRKALGTALLLLPLAGGGCVEPARPTVLGQWTGGWSSGAGSGNLQITFSGKRHLGEIELYDVELVATGMSCPAASDLAAGDRTAAFLHDDLNFAVQFAGGPAGSDEGVFRFDGTFQGRSSLAGTYRLTSASCPQCACALGSSGTWSVTK